MAKLLSRRHVCLLISGVYLTVLNATTSLAQNASEQVPQDQQTRNKGHYGAIAVSADTLSFSAALDYQYSDEAESEALSGCAQHAGDCLVVLRFHNGACGALATGLDSAGKTAWGTAWAFNIRSAQKTALQECQKRVSGCKLKVAECTKK